VPRASGALVLLPAYRSLGRTSSTRGGATRPLLELDTPLSITVADQQQLCAECSVEICFLKANSSAAPGKKTLHRLRVGNSRCVLFSSCLSIATDCNQSNHSTSTEVYRTEPVPRCVRFVDVATQLHWLIASATRSGRLSCQEINLMVPC